MALSIVQFGDRYAIRRGTILTGYRYWDLVTPAFWWPKTAVCFTDCLTQDRHKIEQRFAQIESYGKVIRTHKPWWKFW